MINPRFPTNFIYMTLEISDSIVSILDPWTGLVS